MAEKPDTTNPSRRLFLAAGPAVSVFTALGAATLASPAPSAALALAIDAHKAAQVAVDATPSQGEEHFAALVDLATEALEALAETPCESDADFFVKVAYLVTIERRLWGSELSESSAFGLLALATEMHVEGRTNA